MQIHSMDATLEFEVETDGTVHASCHPCLQRLLALRRIGVVAVTIPFANLAIGPVYEKLRPLILGNPTTVVNGLRLCVVNTTNPLRAAAFYSPGVAVRNYMM